MDFVIGKGQSLFPEWMRFNIELKLCLSNSNGASSVGCSADWPSFGWLDKRPDVQPKQKLVDLIELAAASAKSIIGARFETPFDAWRDLYADLSSRHQDKVPLCLSFCIALVERALIDAFCRINKQPFFNALQQNTLGIKPEAVHPELDGFQWLNHLPQKPLDTVYIRHTVGPLDPVTATDAEGNETPNDDLPHTLEQYVQCNGISYFKIKICGDPHSDIERLQKIWSVIGDLNPTITLDGNEAYDDTALFELFVNSLALQEPALFKQIIFIEQPTNRAATFDATSHDAITNIATQMPLIIDEADGYLHAFSDATKIGYTGVSHKNCKGVFKSICNFARCKFRNQHGSQLFQTGEDLTNMPMIALHQDFAVAAALGLDHIERNGHHFFGGLNHLSDTEQQSASADYPNLYRQLNGQLVLNIDNGQVDISSLHYHPGIGLAQEPDWNHLQPLSDWLNTFKQTLR